MELTPEYIKAVRFTVKRGNTYDAAEVDAFLDELLEAVTALQNRPDADTLAGLCFIYFELGFYICRKCVGYILSCGIWINAHSAHFIQTVPSDNLLFT